MAPVFLKRHVRRKDGKEHVYYSLCESIRLSRERTIQRRVLNLGELNTIQLERWQRSIEVKARLGSIGFLLTVKGRRLRRLPMCAK